MTDTLVLSRLICPDLKNDDFSKKWSNNNAIAAAWKPLAEGAGTGLVSSRATTAKRKATGKTGLRKCSVLSAGRYDHHLFWQHLQPEVVRKPSVSSMKLLNCVTASVRRVDFDIDAAQLLYAKLSGEKIQLGRNYRPVPAVDHRDGVRPEAEQQPLGLRRGRSGHQGGSRL